MFPLFVMRSMRWYNLPFDLHEAPLQAFLRHRAFMRHFIEPPCEIQVEKNAFQQKINEMKDEYLVFLQVIFDTIFYTCNQLHTTITAEHFTCSNCF